MGQVDRLVDAAIAEFMPDTATEIAERAADGLYVRVDHQQVSFAGTSLVQGELDLPDALDLEKALQAGAEQLKALGSTESLDVRRSRALGALARGDQTLDFPGAARQLVVHLHQDSNVATVESPNRLLTADQIAAWCADPETQVILKPVIDLNTPLQTLAYEPTDRIREHVIVRDGVCAYPFCARTARKADLDHIVEWVRGGRTSTLNLAPLCRGHHRLKTFSTWTYRMTSPGVFEWRSPHGYRYLKDRHGTEDLGPPGDPPLP